MEDGRTYERMDGRTNDKTDGQHTYNRVASIVKMVIKDQLYGIF